MRQYEQKFANPLLALAFVDGVEFVGDPDMRALNPTKADDGTWVVVIEDTTDDEEEEQPATISKNDKPDTRITFEEYKAITKKNMVPISAPREPILTPTIFKTIAEPSSTRIIPDVIDFVPAGNCGKCVNCKTGSECINQIYAVAAHMSGRER
jgi:hypothetical protein